MSLRIQRAGEVPVIAGYYLAYLQFCTREGLWISVQSDFSQFAFKCFVGDGTIVVHPVFLS